MRNLEILVQFEGQLAHLANDERVSRACVDEFTKTLFILTTKMNLLIYKYGSPENLADLHFEGSASFEEYEPETSLVVDLKFVQELAAVVVVFGSGAMFLCKDDG